MPGGAFVRTARQRASSATKMVATARASRAVWLWTPLPSGAGARWIEGIPTEGSGTQGENYLARKEKARDASVDNGRDLQARAKASGQRQNEDEYGDRHS